MDTRLSVVKLRAVLAGLLGLSLATAGPVLAMTTTSSDEALYRLEAGNQRFAAGITQHPNLSQSRLRETVEQGQEPFATVLACSDSRVPVELLFDQGVGDLFVIRVAGNVCGVNEIGSIEYGVEHLGTPLLLVLGHEHCGAVTAVATGVEMHGSIPRLIGNIIPAVTRAEALTGKHGEEVVPEAVVENVWQSIGDLIGGSAAVRQRLADGRLKVVGAVYELETGTVRWLGEHPRQAQLLAAGPTSPVHTPEPTVEPPVEPVPATEESHSTHAAEAEAADTDAAGAHAVDAEQPAEEAGGGGMTDEERIQLNRLAIANQGLNSMLMIVTGGLLFIALGLAALAYQVFMLKSG
ncbi:carbonic anhydrase [bacterium]|nr:carbonic anhydrase [bacterium]